MSSYYYLLNDEIRFYFDDNPRTLHYQDTVVKLTPKEAQTLQFAVLNAGNIIRADELAVYLWGEEAVNNDYQNKKSQAITHISKIRKRIDQLKYKKHWLQTEENQGYRFLCTVSHVGLQDEESAVEEPNEEQLQKRRYKLNVAKYSFISVILTVLAVMVFFWLTSESSVQLSNVKPLPPQPGVSSEPRFSPDANGIVFSRELGQGTAGIYLKSTSDINYIRLTEGFFDQAPIFSPNGETIAFHRTDAGKCRIMLLHLNGEFEKAGIESEVTQCSPHTSYSSIAWLSDDLLLFTDKTDKNQPMSVYQLDLNSGERSQYLALPADDSNYYGAGYYYILYDVNDEALFVLDGENWISTNIYRVTKSKQTQLVKTVKDSLRSIAYYQDSIIFKDLDNQLKMFSLEKPFETRVVFTNPLFPIDYPSVNTANNQLAFVSGEYYKSTIHSYNLNSGQSQAVITSDNYIQLPLAEDDEILVVSKESGVNQVYGYTYDRANGHYQISDFQINHKIVGLASSDDKRWLAITFPTGTTLYRRSDRGLSQVQHFPLMVWPDFAQTNQRLLLADHSGLNGDKKRLVEFDLSKYEQTGKIEPSGIVVIDARFGIYRDKEIVYTPDDSHGVYLFSIGGTTLLNGDIYPINPSAFALDKDYLYLAIRGRKIVRLNLPDKEVTELPNALFTSFSVRNNALYFVSKTMGDMNILSGDLTLH